MHHLLYSMSITMNFVVVTVYWTFLHQGALAKHRDVPDVGHLRVIHLYIVHTFPGLACLLNTCTTKAIFRWEWRAVVTIGSIYTIVQFLTIKVIGYEAIYPMINFQDGLRTWIWIAGLVALPVVALGVICGIDGWLKAADLRRKVKRYS